MAKDSLKELMAKLKAPAADVVNDEIKKDIEETKDIVEEEIDEKDPFPELEKKDKELKQEQEDVKEDTDVPLDDEDDGKQVEPVENTIANQIEILQNEGRFRLELLTQLNQINVALAVMARAIGEANE